MRFAAAALIVALTPTVASASMVALKPVSSFSSDVGVGKLFTFAPILGYRFAVSTPVRVTGIAFWDYQANGLKTEIDVSLWTDAGGSLATATIGSNSPLVGHEYYYGRFRFAPIDLLLPVGVYRIAAAVSLDEWIYDSGPPIPYTDTAPGIEYVDRVFSDEGGFPVAIFPGYGGAVGPSFLVVPEPSSLACGALAALAIIRRRRSTT